MKQLLLFVFLCLSTLCFSQIESEQLLGHWEFENITDYNDSILDFPSRKFDLILQKAGDFQLDGEEYTVSGKWQLSNATLSLTGSRNDKKETRTETMKIQSLTDKRVSFEIELEMEKYSLMHLIRIE